MCRVHQLQQVDIESLHHERISLLLTSQLSYHNNTAKRIVRVLSHRNSRKIHLLIHSAATMRRKILIISLL